VSVHGPAGLYFEPLKLLNFDFNADPYQAFHYNPDPDSDPASKNNADTCGSGSAILLFPLGLKRCFVLYNQLITMSRGSGGGEPNEDDQTRYSGTRHCRSPQVPSLQADIVDFNRNAARDFLLRQNFSLSLLGFMYIIA
jgi:hypothetical protein